MWRRLVAPLTALGVLVCASCDRADAPARAEPLREERTAVTKSTRTPPSVVPAPAAPVAPARATRIDARFASSTLASELVAVISKKNDHGPHGVGGLAFDSAGRALFVSDRRLEKDADAKLRVWLGHATDVHSKKKPAFSSLTLKADGCCRENLEALAVGPDGTWWLASDMGAVGKGSFELGPPGAPSALDVRCSHVARGGGCDAEGNDGLEAIAVVGGKVLTVAEKPLGDDKSSHPILRVEFPKLVPIATLHVTSPGSERAQVRVSDAAGCTDALWLLGSYKAQGAYHSVLVRVPHTGGDLASSARAFAIDNPPYGSEQLTPNLEAMAPIDDCKAMLLVNDDSSGNEVEYSATVLRRVTLPVP